MCLYSVTKSSSLTHKLSSIYPSVLQGYANVCLFKDLTNVRAIAVTEIQCGDCKSCNWSAWAACVFSYRFLVPVEIQDDMKQVENKLSNHLLSNAHLTKTSPLQIFCSP